MCKPKISKVRKDDPLREMKVREMRVLAELGAMPTTINAIAATETKTKIRGLKLRGLEEIGYWCYTNKQIDSIM